MEEDFDDSIIKTNFLVEFEKDGRTVYVLCGPMYWFDRTVLSEAAFNGIVKLLKDNPLTAADIANAPRGLLPVSLQVASFQSGKR